MVYMGSKANKETNRPNIPRRKTFFVCPYSVVFFLWYCIVQSDREIICMGGVAVKMIECGEGMIKILELFGGIGSPRCALM